MTELSPSQKSAIATAHILADLGVPIFHAYPNNGERGGEFHYPDRWQTFTAKGSHYQIDKWRPGMALCMVTGVIFDVLDIDPRNGGAEGVKELADALGWDSAGNGPIPYGTARTPSEGEHALIARTGLAKSKPAKGVDLQAGDSHGEGRGFIFIAPTVRTSKYGARKGDPVEYVWIEAPRADYGPAGRPDPGVIALRDYILAGQKPRRSAQPVDKGVDDDNPWDVPDEDWDAASANRVIDGQLAAVQAAREGTVNNALGGAARVLGRFVAGGFLPEDEAIARLMAALDAGGVHSDSWNVANRRDWTANTCILAGMARGAEEPWAVRVVDESSKTSRLVQPSSNGAGGPVGSPAASDLPPVQPRLNAPGAPRELPAPGVPMDVARELLEDYPAALTWWRGDFYQRVPAGTHWEPQEETEIRGWVRLATENAQYLKPKRKEKGQEGAKTEFEAMRWAPTIGKVKEVVAALGEGVLQRPGDDDRVLALTNGVLRDASTGDRVLVPHSPEVFNLTSRPFPYEPGATAPYWLKFLDEVLPDAPDDQHFLQEWFGYVLSGRTDIHAIASLAGQSRSGKGTILRILSAMTGTENVAAGHIDSMVGPFGLEPLIGKSLLAFGDVRWNNKNAQTAIQRILEISGEDRITVPRKNKTDWVGTLGVRIMFAGNEIPRFADPSRAMANRLRIVHFTQSFAGREDYGLTERLMGELPGIFNWALEGLDRLTATGRLSESARSAELRERVGDGGDATTAFADEYLEPAADAWCYEDEVMEAYEEWCQRTRRHRDGSTAETLRSALLDLFPKASNNKDTRRSKRTPSGPRKVRAFAGLKLLAVIPGTEFDED